MKTLTAAAALLILLAAVALQFGCETQSADANLLRVEPAAVGLRNGQSQEFRASGGYSYKWTLSDSSLGFLTTSEGPTTTYINRSNPGENAGVKVQRLTVTSVVGSSQSQTRVVDGTTNTIPPSGFIETAEAVIEHLPSNAPASPTTTTKPSTNAP